jgi:hypothetical protein
MLCPSTSVRENLCPGDSFLSNQYPDNFVPYWAYQGGNSEEAYVQLTMGPSSRKVRLNQAAKPLANNKPNPASPEFYHVRGGANADEEDVLHTHRLEHFDEMVTDEESERLMSFLTVGGGV